jgi:hypothetical protein
MLTSLLPETAPTASAARPTRFFPAPLPPNRCHTEVIITSLTGIGYARFLLTTVVLVTGSAADSTTAASPSALESVTGSRLMVTARLGGMTVVRSSTITSRFCGERLLRELAFFVFLLVDFLLAIQTSPGSLSSRPARNRRRRIVIRTLQCDALRACLMFSMHSGLFAVLAM